MRLTTELPDNTEIPMSDEEHLSIGRGLADADAGRITDGDVVFQRLRARVGLDTGALLPATSNEPTEPLGLAKNA